MAGARTGIGRHCCPETVMGNPSSQTDGPLATSSQVSHQKAKNMNMMICRAAERGNAESLLNIVAMKSASMSCVNLSTAIHKLARLGKEAERPINPNDSRLKVLNQRIQRVLQAQLDVEVPEDVLPRCWATISWAYGTLQFRDAEVTQILELIDQLAMLHLHAFNPLELTNLLWGFARMQIPSSRLFQMSCHFITARLQAFSLSNLSTLVWAFATRRQVESRTLHQIAREFSNRLETSQVNSVEIANLMWGLATAKLHPRGRILHDIGCRALALLPEFKLQELSITAWAFSRLSVCHDALFMGITERLLRSTSLRAQIHSQGIANLLWAFERQKAMDSSIVPQLMMTLQALLPVALQLVPVLKPQEFTCVFQTLTRFGLTWGDCHEADDLFIAGSSAGGSFLRRLSMLQRLDLLEAYVDFMRGHRIPNTCMSFIHALVQVCFETVADLEIIGVQRVIVVAALAVSIVSGDLNRIIVTRVAQLALQVPLDTLPPASLTRLFLMTGLSSDTDLATLQAVLTTCARGSVDTPAQGYYKAQQADASYSETVFTAHPSGFAEQGQDSYEDFITESPEAFGWNITRPQQASSSNHDLLMERSLAVQAALQESATCRAPRSETRPSIRGMEGTSGGHPLARFAEDPLPSHNNFFEPEVPAPHKEYEPQQVASFPLPMTAPVPKRKPNVVTAPPIPEGGSLNTLPMAQECTVKNAFMESVEAHPRISSAVNLSEHLRPMGGLEIDTMEMDTMGIDVATGNGQQEFGLSGVCQLPRVLPATSPEILAPFFTRHSGVEQTMPERREEHMSQTLQATPPMPVPMRPMPSTMEDMASVQPLPEADNSGGGTLEFPHLAPEYVVKNTFVEPAGTKPPISTAKFLSEQPRRMSGVGMDLGALSHPYLAEALEEGFSNPTQDASTLLREILLNGSSGPAPGLAPSAFGGNVDGEQPSYTSSSAFGRDSQMPSGDWSRSMVLTSNYSAERGNMGLKHQASGGDWSREVTRASHYASERNSVTPMHHGASTELSKALPLASNFMSERSSMSPSHHVASGDLPRKLTLASNYKSERCSTAPKDQASSGDLSRGLLLASKYMSEQSSIPSKDKVASVDVSRGFALASKYESERSSLTSKDRTPSGGLYQVVSEDLSRGLEAASKHSFERSSMTSKDQASSGDLSRAPVLASKYKSEWSSMTPSHQAASEDLSRGLLASKYASERSGMTLKHHAASGDLSRALPLASSHQSDLSGMSPKHQAASMNLSRIMMQASNCNSGQCSPSRQAASGDLSKVLKLASNYNSEQTIVSPKHQDNRVSPTSFNSKQLWCAAVPEAPDVGPGSSTDLLASSGASTSGLRVLSPRALLKDLRAGLQAPPDPSRAGRSGLLHTSLGHGGDLATEQPLHALPVGATTEGSSMESPFNFKNAPPFVVKNTFLEFAEDNNAAKAARLWASRFCSEQPRQGLQ